MPKLLERAEQTFESVTRMKAGQHEQLVELLDKVRAIYTEIVPDTPFDALARLDPVDRNLLHRVAHACLDDVDQDFPLEDLAREMGLAHDDLRRSARFLAERDWIRFREVSDSVTATPAGVLLVWRVTTPDAPMHIERLRTALPRSTATMRLGTLMAASDTTETIAYAQLLEWKTRGLLALEDRVYPLTQALIFNVAESLHRGPPESST
jgi:hypothetical protein